MLWCLAITAGGLPQTIQKYLESTEGKEASAARINSLSNLYVGIKFLIKAHIN